MKIFAISDLHLSENCNKPMNIFGPTWEGHFEKIKEDWQQKVGQDDVVLVCGDISWAMKLEDSKPDLNLIGALNGTKIIIKGNHDYWWQSISKVRSICPPSIKALQNDSISFGDVVICGTRGWTVPETEGAQSPEDAKIFNREVLRLELSLKNALNLIEYSKRGQIKTTKNLEELESAPKTVLVMMHYPPFNSKREDSAFTKLLEKYGVSACIYGHLHGKGSRCELITQKNGIKYYLTSCDKLDNKLIQIL